MHPKCQKCDQHHPSGMSCSEAQATLALATEAANKPKQHPLQGEFNALMSEQRQLEFRRGELHREIGEIRERLIQIELRMDAIICQSPTVLAQESKQPSPGSA